MAIHLPDVPGDGPCDCGTFFLDVVGPFDRDHVTHHWSDAARATNDELERLIDQAWQVALWQARRKGLKLFNGPLARLVEYRPNGHGLDLTFAPVTYKEFHGTNQSHANVRYLHGPDVLADPLGVSAALITSDGFIMLGRRSERLIQYADRIHPIGGMVEPPLAQAAGIGIGIGINTFAAMLKELREETSIGDREVAGISLLGLVRDKHTVQPELIFDISLSADACRVKCGAAEAEDASEHTEMIPLRNHPAAVVTFMEQNFSQLTPVALATLLLHGLVHWGSGWFAAARGYLRSVI